MSNAYAAIICVNCGAEMSGWLAEQCDACGMEYAPSSFAKSMAELESWDLPIYQAPGCACTLEGDTMSVSEQVQEHISSAALLIIPAASSMQKPGAGTIAECIHALLWPYVVAAAEQFNAPAAETVPGAEDKRSKPWQYVARFWRETPGTGDAELAGETEPAITTSTGNLPKIITDLAAQMHEGADIEAFELENLKALLPQFRNNLGRGTSAVLRIGPYEAEGATYRCQVDVYRLNNGS